MIPVTAQSYRGESPYHIPHALYHQKFARLDQAEQPAVFQHVAPEFLSLLCACHLLSTDVGSYSSRYSLFVFYYTSIAPVLALVITLVAVLRVGRFRLPALRQGRVLQRSELHRLHGKYHQHWYPSMSARPRYVPSVRFNHPSSLYHNMLTTLR